MKKSIKILVKKLEQDQHGKLTGGFSAIKGGFKSFAIRDLESTNESCTNKIGCSQTTNNNSCTNSFSC